MANLQTLEAALRKAHEAGDSGAAKIFASEIRKALSTGSPVSPVTQPPAQEQSAAADLVRPAEFGARGVIDSLSETVGFVPDLVSSGLRNIGLENYVPPEGYYADSIKSGINTLSKTLMSPVNRGLGFIDSEGKPTGKGGPNKPVSDLEKGSYGAGRGAGDAGAFMVPGLALAKTAKAGSTAANVGKTLLAQPVAQTVAGSVGGATTELTDSPLTGIGASMATTLSAGGLVKAAKRLAHPIKDQMSRQAKNVVEAAEREGIKLTAGQATGSKTLRNVEAGFSELPLSASAQGRIHADQRQAFNRAVLRKAGIDSDDAGPDVINKAYISIGKEFDDLAARTEVSIDKKFFDDIDEITRRYANKLETTQSPLVRSLKEEFDGFRGLLKEKPFMKGPDFQRVSSELKELARSQVDGSWPQKTLYKYANALDDALERSFKTTSPTSTGSQVSVNGGLSGNRQVSTQINRGEQAGLLKQWKDVRNRYRNLLQIDKAVKGGDPASEVAGDVPFQSFKGAVKSFDQTGYGRGRGDFNDLSRIASLLQSSIPPNSGTAQRQLMMRSLQGEPVGKVLRKATPGTAGATAGAVIGGVPGAVVGGVGALAIPKLSQMAMNTPSIQSWLKNTKNIPAPERDKMLRTLLQKVYAAQGIGDLTSSREN